MSSFGAGLEHWMRARGIGVRELHRRSGYSAGYITQLRQGLRNPSPEAARDLDDALGAGGELAACAVTRSTALAGTGSVFDGIPGQAAGDPGDALASVLAGLPPDPGREPVTDLAALTASAGAARAAYQDCRYAELNASLAGLIVTLDGACAALSGDAAGRAQGLSADAHHVAAGLLLKRGDLGLAMLAADRSMRAAVASGDPVTVAASARIITHALMSSGHLAAAVATAARHAARLERDAPGQGPQSLSVYGALLLRGAMAAAQAGNRETTAELLGEARRAARQLGSDANHRWTAFGPVNTELHRVSAAVTLGDAGTAIDIARAIPLASVTVTERKATLLVDTARAFLQRGWHENAYRALRAAHAAAPEEVTGRASVLALVRDLAATAPPSLRRDTAQFAAAAGATA